MCVSVYVYTRKPCVSPSAETAKQCGFLLVFFFLCRKRAKTPSAGTQASNCSCGTWKASFGDNLTIPAEQSF